MAICCGPVSLHVLAPETELGQALSASVLGNRKPAGADIAVYATATALADPRDRRVNRRVEVWLD